MKAMVLLASNRPLELLDIEKPRPKAGEVLIKVAACGVCRTDLHILDGELDQPKLPLVLGHQVVGSVVGLGDAVKHLKLGDRVGVPWLGETCGQCEYCQSHRENLCDNPVFTGYTKDGGFAEFTVANEAYCFLLEDDFNDLDAPPLLCGGLIGYRAYGMTGSGKRLGIFGFGSAASMITQVALFEGKEVYAFTRPGDSLALSFALKLGCTWAGSSDVDPGVQLDAAIIFASVGSLVPTALKLVKKGATVVCAGIHMSDIPAMRYRLLSEERVIRSVGNLTRKDGEDFLKLAHKISIKTHVWVYSLDQANEALNDLREGRITGSVVLQV